MTTHSYPNGDIFVGSMITDDNGKIVKHGPGVFTQITGHAITGHWNYDILISGRGSKVHSKGYILEGEFKGDRLHGHGKLTFKSWGDRFDVFECEWQDGKPCGYGTYTQNTEPVRVRTGMWNGHLFTGKGSYKDKFGNVYDGEWENDKPHGRGKCTDRFGCIEEGFWHHGEFMN